MPHANAPLSKLGRLKLARSQPSRHTQVLDPALDVGTGAVPRPMRPT